MRTASRASATVAATLVIGQLIEIAGLTATGAVAAMLAAQRAANAIALSANSQNAR